MISAAFSAPLRVSPLLLPEPLSLLLLLLLPVLRVAVLRFVVEVGVGAVFFTVLGGFFAVIVASFFSRAAGTALSSPCSTVATPSKLS